MVAKSPNYDHEISKINGYTFQQPQLLSGVDNVAVAYGQRFEQL